MKVYELAAAVLCLPTLCLVSTSSLGEESKCVAMFKDQLSNTHIGTYELATNAFEFFNRCEKDGTVNSANAHFANSFIAQMVPVEEKEAFSYNHQTVKDFCLASAKSQSIQARYDQYDHTVVVDALKYANQCIALENDGLELNYSYQAPGLITITGHMRNGYEHPDLDSLTYLPENAATCSSTNFSMLGLRKKISPTGSRLTLPSDFSIQCQRIGQDWEGSTYYPAVQISASVSKTRSNGNKPYEISVPSDASYGPQLQSRANASIQSLEKERKALQDDVSALQQSLRQQTVVDTKYFYMGENSQQPLGGTHYGGVKGSDQDWQAEAEMHAKKECGKNKVGRLWHLAADSQGQCCGYKHYVVTCVAPDTGTSASK